MNHNNPFLSSNQVFGLDAKKIVKYFIILNKFFIVYSILFFITSCGEEVEKKMDSGNELYVNSKNGLNLRTEPKKNAKLITTIPYGTPVNVLENTGIFETIHDKKGEWLKVKTEKHSGYAFGGFLISYENVNVQQELQDLRLGDVKPNHFSPDNKFFSYGLNCSGLTYSEYSEVIQFKEGSVEKVLDVMEEFGADNSNTNVSEPCFGSISHYKSGSHTLLKNKLIIKYDTNYSITVDCNGKETVSPKKNISITEEYELVSCHGKQAMKQIGSEPNYYFVIQNHL